MINSKIFICGNFGYKNNQIDGQTIRTRTIKDTIIAKLNKRVVIYVDTSYIKLRPISVFIKIYRNFRKSSNIIMLPGSRGLRVFLPLFIRWKIKYKKDLRYVVIGGWLPNFLTEKKKYLDLCKELNRIYVGTKFMREKLQKLGLINVSILPNFRQFTFKKSVNKVINPIKLVYFSRICEEKGIELAIKAVNNINKNKKDIKVKFDIYGPIMKDYRYNFRKILAKCGEFISYKGILEPINNNIYENLSNYDLMIFPTFYKGEGFAGAILDSFISGVPVLASDWKYNSEIIKENITGKLFVSKDIQDLTDKLKFLIKNPDLIYKMKKNCLEEAKKYSADFVLDNLIKDIGLKE